MYYQVEKYGAEWCHGCKVMDKILAKVLPQFPNVNYKKIDVDTFTPEEKEAFNINFGTGIPVLVIKDEMGLVMGVQSGAKSIGATSAFLATLVEVSTGL